jgi:nitroreductase
MDYYSDRRRSEAENLMAAQSTAMAAQKNVLLAAHSEGLGACVMCAPLFCPDTVAAALDLPAEWRAQMLITVGGAASGANERPRLAAKEVTIWISGNGPRSAGC